MRKTKRAFFGGALVGISMLISFMSTTQFVKADTPSIIINEIQYNPSGQNQIHEFIELYNTTNDPIDISGWCFTDGVSLCFETDTIIAGNGYGVVSPNATASLILYQVYTIGTYSGQLSNSGETLTLSDASNSVINSVTYSDSAPWPVSADGNGYTLELKDPGLDSALVSSWGASLVTHTAGFENSLVGAPEPPSMTSLSQPMNITNSDSPVVTVEAQDATGVNLFYKVQFEEDQSVEMTDDGIGADALASDGIYSASIPAQDSGVLVRYKAVASNGLTSASLPSFDQTALFYQGYVVRDSSHSSNLPILQWFMNDADYEDMVTNHVFDRKYFNCVIAYGDQVVDNVQVRVKGEVSLNFPKKSLKFKLPKTSKIEIEGKTPRPLNEFHMNAEWLDDSKARTVTAWEMANEMGIDTPAVFGTRLLRNNAYHGYFLFAEKYHTEFQEEKGYNGSLYEDYDVPVNDNAEPETINSWRDNMLGVRSDVKRNYVLDNHNIPNIINFMAFQSSINNVDWYSLNNLFSYKDDVGLSRTNRWSLLPWDLDIIFEQYTGKTLISPYVTPYHLNNNVSLRFMATPLYDELDIREMFFRRLRTFVDEFYSSDQFLENYRQNANLAQVEAQLDILKWGTTYGNFSTGNQDWYENRINFQKKQLLSRYQLPRAIPSQQVDTPNIQIDEVNSSFIEAEQYIKLTNPGSAAVDISGWNLEELSYEIPAGSVIPSGGSAYIVRNDLVGKLADPGRFVIGQLSSSIPSSGIITLVRSNETVADSQSYLGL